MTSACPSRAMADVVRQTPTWLPAGGRSAGSRLSDVAGARFVRGRAEGSDPFLPRRNQDVPLS